MRVLPRREGCEVRFGESVVVGNEDLAALLAYVHSDPTGELLPHAAALPMPAEEFRTLALRTLASLVSAGADPTVWGPGWTPQAAADGRRGA
ncbi:hypothetical protein [Streptomyces venezuelae]|uniref:hypothetical protein n=1 Tax=Streptomyces venezuelae TaxID=54571 RepID=UPI00379ED50E